MGVVAEVMCETVKESFRRLRGHELDMLQNVDLSFSGLIKRRLALLVEFLTMTSTEVCDDEKHVWRCLLAVVDRMVFFCL